MRNRAFRLSRVCARLASGGDRRSLRSKGVIVMLQQGQVFRLSGNTEEGSVWAYRYRVGGRGSMSVQRGGFASERDASEALERALERVRRERGCGSALTLGELVDEYLAQHDGEPETIDKLRWLLTKPVKVFGTRRLPELRSQEIAAWRMTIPPGHRFEATQARPSSGRAMGRWCCSRPRPGCGRGSGSRSSSATSIGRRASSMCAAPTGTADSSARRPKPACARCRYRPLHSERSSNYPTGRARCCFRRPGADTSICTTSATETGNRPSAPPASRRCDASTICVTPSRPLPFVPESPPSTSPATWAPAWR